MANTRVGVEVTSDTKDAVTGIKRVDDAVDDLGQEAEEAGRKGQEAQEKYDGFQESLTGFANSVNEIRDMAETVAEVVGNVANLAGEYATLEAKLGQYLGGQEAANAAMDELFAIAQRTRTALSDTGAVFAKTAKNAENVLTRIYRIYTDFY